LLDILAHLERLLEVLDVVTVDVVVGSDGLAKFGPNNHARALGGGPTSEKHYSCTSVLEGRLK
jgi:hypothetical protein